MALSRSEKNTSVFWLATKVGGHFARRKNFQAGFAMASTIRRLDDSGARLVQSSSWATKKQGRGLPRPCGYFAIFANVTDLAIFAGLHFLENGLCRGQTRYRNAERTAAHI